MKYTLKATIGLPNYSNLQPEIELEGDDINQLHAVAMEHINGLWARHSDSPLKDNSGGGVKLTTFTGEEVLYDELQHSYFDLDGNKLLSGSYYAGKQSPPFNKDGALIGSSKKFGVDKEELGAVWDLLGDVSRHYGNAIHSALELYHNHSELGEKVAKGKDEEFNYALSKIPHIKDCVESFVNKFGTDAMMEVLVSDVKNKMAGRIDRLVILDKEKKLCRVGDFKTNYNLTDKKLLEYQHQLSFYAHILINHGWTVQGIDIYHYSDEWKLIELEVLELAPHK